MTVIVSTAPAVLNIAIACCLAWIRPKRSSQRRKAILRLGPRESRSEMAGASWRCRIGCDGKTTPWRSCQLRSTSDLQLSFAYTLSVYLLTLPSRVPFDVLGHLIINVFCTGQSSEYRVEKSNRSQIGPALPEHLPRHRHPSRQHGFYADLDSHFEIYPALCREHTVARDITEIP